MSEEEIDWDDGALMLPGPVYCVGGYTPRADGFDYRYTALEMKDGRYRLFEIINPKGDGVALGEFDSLEGAKAFAEGHLEANK